MPEVNDIAPDFTLPRDGGGEVSLASLRGAPVVLFFYPKDDTPGCTKESIGFSADLGAFQDAGAQVFGISKDSVAKHDKFVAKHDLKTGMLSDETGTTCEAHSYPRGGRGLGGTHTDSEATAAAGAAVATARRRRRGRQDGERGSFHRRVIQLSKITVTRPAAAPGSAPAARET